MNIGFDAKRFFHNRRGLGNYSRDTIRLLSAYYPDNNYLLFNPSIKNCVPNILNSNTTMVIPDTIIRKAIPSWWRTFGMKHDFVSKKLDIYHGLSQELPVGIEKTGVKTVVTMHDAIFMRYPELYSCTYRQFFIRKNRYACRVADRIIAISEQTKRDMMSYFDADEAKIDVVYQGCNAIFRQPASDSDKQQIRQKYQLPQQFLLTVGAIEKRKNAEVIIKALHAERITIPFVLVGAPTDYVKDLKQLVRQYNMEQQVIFLHYVASDELPAIYSMASLFVYPSVFEGFGIPVLEALCVGTPVVASTGTCFEEVGGTAAHYVNPHDVEQWATEIKHLLTDDWVCQNMRQDGLSRSELFVDKSVAKSLMAVYEKLI